jgi:putrescine transport system ATP-binding protein
MSEPVLRLSRLTKKFGTVTAVDQVSLDIRPGEFFALLGPSGCGKTTLMRMIAGFETPDSGVIDLEGRDLSPVPPHQRPVNMMFQSYALFPHMSVEKNIAFGLVQEGLPKAEIATRVADMLDLVQLKGLAARKPHQLSGGQKQRVALARALAKRPKLLLLDEPLAALDRKLREDTQFELMRIQRELGASFMVVTHDQDEAMAMAQRIAVMRAGVIEQIGPPQEVYLQPANKFVAGFIGKINLFDAKVVASTLGRSRLAFDAGFEMNLPRADLAVGSAITLAVRPEDLVVEASGEGAAGQVLDSVFLGETSLTRIALANGQVVQAARMNAARNGVSQMHRGDAVRVQIPPNAARVLTS